MPQNMWLGILRQADLEQGDLLLSFSAPRVVMRDGAPVAKVATSDYIVITQSCDLENGKVDEVLLAPVYSYQLLAQQNQAYRSKGHRKSLANGLLPNLALLYPYTPRLEWAVADFHKLRLVDIELAVTHARVDGVLRMNSPYREYLGQAFARYIMRVGLPLPADDFVSGSWTFN